MRVIGTARLAAAFGLLATLMTGCGSGHAVDAGADAALDAADDASLDAALACLGRCPDRCLDGVCAECLLGEQCPSGRCFDSHRCQPFDSCDTAARCTESRPFCLDNRCVQCATDLDCGSIERGPICSVAAGQICVQCAHDTDCPSGTCDHYACTGGACAARCADGERIDVFGRCVPRRACEMSCAAGERCDTVSGRCELEDSSSCDSRCGWPEVCDELGRCMPPCPCPEGEVWYASLDACAPPADCAAPQTSSGADPTRCLGPPCDAGACPGDDLCVDGRCTRRACGAAPQPYVCMGRGSFLPGSASAPSRRLPAVRVAILGSDAAPERVGIAEVPNGSWDIFWVAAGELMRARLRVGALDSSADCYELGVDEPVMTCTLPIEPALPFDTSQIEVNRPYLGAAAGGGTPGAGLWRLMSSATSPLCAQPLALGMDAASSLEGLRLSYDPQAHAPELYGLSPGTPGYPRLWSETTRRDLTATEWDAAFPAGDVSPPAHALDAASGISAYATEDGRVVVWDGHMGPPLLLADVDAVMRGPLVFQDFIDVSVLALRSAATGAELVTTSCRRGAADSGGPPSCSAAVYQPFDDILPEQMQAALAGSGGSFLFTVGDSAGGYGLSLRFLGSDAVGPAVRLFDARHTGAPIRRVLAAELQPTFNDLVWAAIVDVDRSAGPQLELWVGGLRVCHSTLGP